MSNDYDMNLVWQDIDYLDENVLINGRDCNNIKVGHQMKKTQEALRNLKESIGENTTKTILDKEYT